MTSIHVSSLLAVVAVLHGGCSPPAAPSTPTAAPAVDEPATDAVREAGELDGRAPVPLLPPMAVHMREQMREHLVTIEAITAALADDDLDRVATAADTLGTSPSSAAMCEHMGAGAPGFTERGLELHRSADGIAEAARAGDRAATLRALSSTLSTCTGCHAAYRQEVVDSAEWARRTSHGH
jgi:hypothetical protein